MQNRITAVDYLIKEFSEILGPLQTQGMQDLFLADAINKAKEMFQEQIEEAVSFGDCRGKNTTYLTASEYYAQTFKQQ
jgi:hypothetical protein